MNFKTIAAAGLLAASALPALSQEALPIPLVLTPTSGLSSSVTFDRDVNGLFVDTFVFTPASFAGSVAVEFAPLEGSINFFSALLNGQGFSFFPEDGKTNFSFTATVDANTPLELTLFGFSGDPLTLLEANGAYRGTVMTGAVAAVPEPETYALLLAGLFFVGAARRLSGRMTS